MSPNGFRRAPGSDDEPLSDVLGRASELLGAEVVEALESKHKARLESTDEVMDGDKLLFRAEEKRGADRLLSIAGAKCFRVTGPAGSFGSQQDGASTGGPAQSEPARPPPSSSNKTLLCSGPLEVLLVKGRGDDDPHTVLRISDSFHYALPEQRLPVLVLGSRNIVLPTKDPAVFFGIVLPANTHGSLLSALKEILESQSVLNDSKSGAGDGTKDDFLDQVSARAASLFGKAKEFGGEVSDHAVVQSLLTMGRRVGDKVKAKAKDVAGDIKKAVEELKSEIEAEKTQAGEGGTFTSATAKVLGAKVKVAATEAKQTAIAIGKEVSKNVKQVVDSSRGEDGVVSPKELAINVGKRAQKAAMSTADRASALAKKGVSMAKETAEDLKLSKRLAAASKAGGEGLRLLGENVDKIIASAKEGGGKTVSGTKRAIERLSELSKRIDVLKKASALGSWTSEQVAVGVVALKKNVAEVQTLLKDKHVAVALRGGIDMVQGALTDTVHAIDDAGKGKKNSGEKMTAMLDKGAELTVKGIKASADMAAMAIKLGKAVVKSKVHARSRAMKLDPRIKSAIVKAQQYSAGAAVISEAMVKELVGNAGEIADKIAVAVSKAAKTRKREKGALEKKLGMLSKIEGSVGAAAKQAGDVVGHAAKAWSEIVVAMRDAGVLLVGELGDATHELAEHRFGKELGDVVGAGVGTYTNLTKAMGQVEKLSDVKGIAQKNAVSALKSAAAAYTEEDQTSEGKQCGPSEGEAKEAGETEGDDEADMDALIE